MKCNGFTRFLLWAAEPPLLNKSKAPLQVAEHPLIKNIEGSTTGDGAAIAK